MEITKKRSEFYHFSITIKGKEVARARLFLIHNKLHDRPYGLLEDVFVDKTLRGFGHGTKLVDEVIRKAKLSRCYKLIATSRFGRNRVHELYKKIGFSEHGIEFRMEF